MQDDATIGEKIKNLRLATRMTTAEVAEQLGISEERLVEIEAQKLSPPLGDIVKLANIFGVPVGDIFGDKADSPFCIVRKDARTAVSRFDASDGKSYGYSYEGLGQGKKNRKMEPFLVTLVPEEVHKIQRSEHIGEEFLFVLEGSVKVTLLDHTDILNPGDSIYYDSTLPHIVACEGEEPATILAVIYARDEMIIL